MLHEFFGTTLAEPFWSMVSLRQESTKQDEPPCRSSRVRKSNSPKTANTEELSKQAKNSYRPKPFVPQNVTVNQPQVAAADNQKDIQHIVAPLEIEYEHENTQARGARVADVPYNPRLGHISYTRIQSVMHHVAAGAAARYRPYGALALRRDCIERGQMSESKMLEHDESVGENESIPDVSARLWRKRR